MESNVLFNSRFDDFQYTGVAYAHTTISDKPSTCCRRVSAPVESVNGATAR